MSYHVEQYNSYRDTIHDRKKELEEMMRNVDLAQQDILHFLENEKCDAATMAKTTKRLVLLRKQRREIKEEWEYVNWIWQKISKQMVERKFTGYRYRTNIMKEIKGD